ncbi:hypothetical protein [uncultured Microbacterium sp.]|uniref:Squalene cyclase n=1 Tax=uncultured Microbacterium sp. TaxID=191216 RepID=A0A1Y5P747_9MICO|nr:hypothetical protein [uncultured Microbacterium sp.]SBS74457.1 conserved hypothetical protein [uncultured Microbacterium sp.]
MDDVLDHLLSGDPAIRWQVLRDLTDARPEDVAAERAKVAVEGWGARLLALQAEDGLWDGGTYRPGWADEDRPMFDAWTATHFSLQQLVDFGVDPDSPAARVAVERVRVHVRWEHAGEPYFDGEVEPCINGVALSVAAYFGQDGHRLIDTLLAGQLADGGWNCWDDADVSSLHSTICALEGLRDADAATGDDRIPEACRRAEEYLLARRLLWRRGDGGLIDPRFGMLSYPVRWFYDVLRALDHFRLVNRRDPRLADAVALLRAKRLPNGLWPLENTHEGPTLFAMEREFEGFPSRWVTLRALRVLRWCDAS